jgi:hypothetical protein
MLVEVKDFQVAAFGHKDKESEFDLGNPLRT